MWDEECPVWLYQTAEVLFSNLLDSCLNVLTYFTSKFIKYTILKIQLHFIIVLEPEYSSIHVIH